MSFFDTSERGALTLTLTRHDPFDADYLTPEGIPLYRVRTCRRQLSPEVGIGKGFGYFEGEVTSVFRVRAPSSRATLTSSKTSSSIGDSSSGEKTLNGEEDVSSPLPSPRVMLSSSASVGLGPYRRHSQSRRRSHRTSSLLSTPLEPIDEVTDGDGDGDTDKTDATDANVDVEGVLHSDLTPESRLSSPSASDADSDAVLIATIERRPLSLSPARLTFNGNDGPASKYLRRERPFSSTRCFLSITGDLLKWQLSTPTPKLYTSNKSRRLAKYSRAFLPDPSKGILSPRTAVLEIAEGIENDKALDEIIVTLLLTFML